MCQMAKYIIYTLPNLDDNEHNKRLANHFLKIQVYLCYFFYCLKFDLTFLIKMKRFYLIYSDYISKEDEPSVFMELLFKSLQVYEV